MTKKYSISVPDIVGNVMENMAIAQGDKPTSVANFLLATEIRTGLASGKYPVAWAKSPAGAAKTYREDLE